MLSNVLYDRKNMLYEELLAHVTNNCMLVTCCIDAHFTGFQVLPGKRLLYYDPLNASLSYVSGDGFNTLVGFLLLKCNYGNSQHAGRKPPLATKNLLEDTDGLCRPPLLLTGATQSISDLSIR